MNDAYKATVSVVGRLLLALVAGSPSIDARLAARTATRFAPAVLAHNAEALPVRLSAPA